MQIQVRASMTLVTLLLRLLLFPRLLAPSARPSLFLRIHFIRLCLPSPFPSSSSLSWLSFLSISTHLCASYTVHTDKQEGHDTFKRHRKKKAPAEVFEHTLVEWSQIPSWEVQKLVSEASRGNFKQEHGERPRRVRFIAQTYLRTQSHVRIYWA